MQYGTRFTAPALESDTWALLLTGLTLIGVVVCRRLKFAGLLFHSAVTAGIKGMTAEFHPPWNRCMSAPVLPEVSFTIKCAFQDVDFHEKIIFQE
ncbi:hypothetical protein [Nitrosomonas sp.]|uniref:hypothetical protein n=1 Tax=Nitrosomonas sp. TaxID=42353 RepID=UPI001D52CEE5|nr:hypothetical protein [Nitrosomonas sp.]MBX3615589.1 hypothetical protein [Nitrosomonas sp.]